MGPELPWWAGAVIYQIYPFSFADADGDGVGDLPGILAHLDHLTWLGVDAIWLSPFYPSPMADFGYDVSDHCDVDPRFGTLDDAHALIAGAHERGLRVLIDFVPNHTSDRHPWFEASRSDRHDPKRHWYYWRDPGPDGEPPNNWRAAFTGDSSWEPDETGQLRPHWGLPTTDDSTAWTLDPATGQMYLHTFLPEQPDLDWHHDEVVAAQHDVLRFWLDAGVDGFRVDSIITLGKPPGLPDAHPELAMFPLAGLADDDFTRAKVVEMRTLLDGYDNERALLGEVGGLDVTSIGSYIAEDLFHLAFGFPPLFDRWDSDRWHHHIDEAVTYHGEATWPTWVLSNHDIPRHTERYGTAARARAAAVLLLGVRGTAVLYAGEELGLRDAAIPPELVQDPGHRDGCRAPIPWTPDAEPGATTAHGWGLPTWLPFPVDADGHDVQTQRDDPSSVLHLYRRLLEARRASPALRYGTFAWAPSPPGVLAWHRRVDASTPPDSAASDNTPTDTSNPTGGGGPGDNRIRGVGPAGNPITGSHDDDERLVVVSFVDEPSQVPPPDPGWVIEVSSHGDGSEVGRPWTGHLGPDEAIIARRG